MQRARVLVEFFLSQLQFTVSKSEQLKELTNKGVEEGKSFYAAKSKTTTLKHSESSQIKYDFSPLKFDMFKNNPEEFVTKVIWLIKE